MMHTNKMILVPHDIAQKDKPIDTLLSNLDAEMKKILNNDHLPADKKLNQYNQVLQRYMRTQVQKQQPYELPVLDTKVQTQPLTRRKYSREVEENLTGISDDDILAGMPKKSMNNAEMLLHYLHLNPHISIEDTGEIIVDGTKIPRSNIIDLVHDFSRDRKTRLPAIGAEVFARALKQMNIPLESIGNRNRLQFFHDDQQTDDDEMRTPTSDILTPTQKLNWDEE